MKKDFLHKLSQKGSLMVEALAMLGLISMVTPVLYKKAAERTTEMQDVNAASEMRNITKAVDDYIRDNYDDIVNGREVVRNTTDGTFKTVNYGGFNGMGEKSLDIPIEHIEEYLPYGFLENGQSKGSKIFSDYEVVIKKSKSSAGDNRKTLTGFAFAYPHDGDRFPLTRSSRIASMIGSNGGFSMNANQINGVQGIWGIDNINTKLGLSGVPKATVVAASMHPINSGTSEMSDEVLYRIKKPNPELNTMRTAIDMGNNSLKAVNQLVITAQGSDFAGGTNKDSALLVEDGGASIAGRIVAAGNKFKVDTNEMSFSDGANVMVKASATGLEVGNATGKVRADMAGNLTTTGNVTATGNLVANGQLDVTGTSSLKGDTVVGVGAVEAGNKLTVRGNAFVDGVLSLNQLRAKKGDIGTLRAGVTENRAVQSGVPDSEYGMIVTNTNTLIRTPTVVNNTFTVNNTTGAQENFKVNTLDSYTYARGLKAGIVTGTQYPFEVLNDATGNVNVNLKAATSRMQVSDSSNRIYLTAGGPSNADSRLFYINSGGVATGIKADANYLKIFFKEAWNSATNKEAIVLSTALSGGGYDFVANDASQFKILRSTTDNIFAVDSDSRHKSANYSTTANTAGKASVYVAKSVLEVGDQSTTNVDPVFKVSGYKPDTDTDKKKGTVNVRKGIIQIASNQDSANRYAESETSTGYIQADRLLANRKLDTAAIPIGQVPAGTSSDPTSSKYDAYQVNPAYTSVMHDIKLTTRGGSRLSDILPDFVNKGIYVVDNTYAYSIGNWETFTPANGVITGKATCASHGNCDTSPWLGFVPKPLCPPGYAKVVTMTPAGFLMSQAGIPQKPAGEDLIINRNPMDYFKAIDNNITPPSLYFQKNTWLKSAVYSHNLTGSNFQGWSAIMGFIYPAAYYKEYITAVGITGVNLSDPKTVVWNLFPVYRKELEAYATVYCYFDRLSTKFDANYVDKYDQLNAYRAGQGTKPVGYRDRLNDPKVKTGVDKYYDDPW